MPCFILRNNVNNSSLKYFISTYIKVKVSNNIKGSILKVSIAKWFDSNYCHVFHVEMIIYLIALIKHIGKSFFGWTLVMVLESDQHNREKTLFASFNS